MKPIKALTLNPFTQNNKYNTARLSHSLPSSELLFYEAHGFFFSYYISIFLPIQARRRESKNQNTGGVILKKREHIVLKLSSVPLIEVDCLD